MKKTIFLTLLSFMMTLSLQAQAQTNLVSNPGFASKLSSWTSSGASVSVTTLNAHSGTYAARIGSSTGTLKQTLTQKLSHGKKYRLTFYAKVSSSSTTANVTLRQRDAALATISSSVIGITSTSYTKFTNDFTYSDAADSFRILISKTGSTGYVYVDDFSLTELSSDPSVTVTTTDTWTKEFMTLINDHRVSIGLNALTHVDGLGLISSEHSQDMATGKVAFGHTGFTDRCSDGRTVIGGGNWCGENVAMGQKTPEAAFTAWMNSPGHRANIEQAKATHTGFGYAKDSSGKYYWTQLFLQKL